jgi:thymidylate synthase (FAD)
VYQVQLKDFMGTDLSVVNAARVSFDKQSETLTDADKGLIRFLMKNKHATPFEHAVLQFYVETNRRVSAEFMRHRTFSYNEMSTRYTEVVPEGYVPDDSHMRIQKGRPGAYRFEAMDPALAHELQAELAAFNENVAAFYESLLARGYPKELAAYVLTLGNTTKFWVTGNLRNWFNFLTLRTAPNALMEIRDVADAIEEHVKERFPECHAAWEESGRGQI